MDVEKLKEEYGHWGENALYPVADWKAAVADDVTRLGYWEWVVEAIKDFGA